MEFKLEAFKPKPEKSIIETNNDWRPVPDFPHYEINKDGQVRRLSDYIVDSNGVRFYRKGRILKTKTNYQGYVSVTLTENGKSKGLFIHNLLAKVFIPNPNNLPCVNHIDENPSNNKLENLEWVTYSQNALHSIDKINKSHDKERILIIRIEPYTKEIKKYNGIRNAAKDVNGNHSNIRMAIKRKCLAYGYFWTDEENYDIKDYSIENLNKRKYKQKTQYVAINIFDNKIYNADGLSELKYYIESNSNSSIQKALNNFKLIKAYLIFTKSFYNENELKIQDFIIEKRKKYKLRL